MYIFTLSHYNITVFLYLAKASLRRIAQGKHCFAFYEKAFQQKWCLKNVLVFQSFTNGTMLTESLNMPIISSIEQISSQNGNQVPWFVQKEAVVCYKYAYTLSGFVSECETLAQESRRICLCIKFDGSETILLLGFKKSSVKQFSLVCTFLLQGEYFGTCIHKRLPAASILLNLRLRQGSCKATLKKGLSTGRRDLKISKELAQMRKPNSQNFKSNFFQLFKCLINIKEVKIVDSSQTN